MDLKGKKGFHENEGDAFLLSLLMVECTSQNLIKLTLREVTFPSPTSVLSSALEGAVIGFPSLFIKGAVAMFKVSAAVNQVIFEYMYLRCLPLILTQRY